MAKKTSLSAALHEASSKKPMTPEAQATDTSPALTEASATGVLLGMVPARQGHA